MGNLRYDFRAKLSLLMLALLFTALGTSQTFAQGKVKNYKYTTMSNKFSSINSTGTRLTSGDDNLTTFSLPFNFNYDSTVYSAGTTMYVCTNGFLAFQNNTAYQYSNYYASTSANSQIGPFQADLMTNSGSTDGVFYQTTGSSPNRVLTVEWSNVSDYSYNSTNATYFQVKLYEGTNVIDMIFNDKGKYTGGNTKGTYLNGNPASTDAQQYTSSTSTPSVDVRWTPPSPPVFPQLSVQPKTLAFGNVTAGNSSSLTYTVRNTGASGTLIFTQQNNSGADFTISQRIDSIQYGGPAVTVTVTFNATTSGNRTGSITYVTNANPNDSATQTVNFTGTSIAPEAKVVTTELFRKVRRRFGDTVLQSFLVQSTGTGPLSITGAQLLGDYPDQYFIKRIPGPIAPGTSDTVIVGYIPTIEGLRPATLKLTTNALITKSFSVNLFGTGILPRLTVTPSPLRFDSVRMGDTLCQSLTFSNPGSDTVTVTANLLSSADPDFMYSGVSGTTAVIAPDRSQTVNICFSPRKQGSRAARLMVRTNIPLTYETVRKDTGVFYVDITGTGVAAGAISVTGNTGIDSVLVDNEICRMDTIRNTGAAEVVVSSVTITGTDAALFTLTGAPTKLIAGQSAVVQICAKPNSRGLHADANITVVGTTGGKSITMNFPIGVYGLYACGQSDQTSLFSTSKVVVGQSETATVEISNCGEVPMVYTAALAAGAPSVYTLEGTTTSATIAPGDKATFSVKYMPTDRSTSTGTLNVTANGISPVTVQLGGQGVGVTLSGTANVPYVEVGKSQNFDAMITNNGNTDYTPGTPTFTGPYTLVTGPTTIPAGQTGTFSVTYTPTSVAGNPGTMTFPLGAPTEAPSFSLNLTPAAASGVAIASAQGFSLMQNFPNPFASQSEVRFVVPRAERVTLTVQDITGRTVRTLFEGMAQKGENHIEISAEGMAAGTYTYTLQAGSVVVSRQMVLKH